MLVTHTTIKNQFDELRFKGISNTMPSSRVNTGGIDQMCFISSFLLFRESSNGKIHIAVRKTFVRKRVALWENVSNEPVNSHVIKNE